jgi:signal transduction histidine kinase
MRLPIRATLGLKLALVLFGVVVGALGIVYLMVVPRLEARLVDQKLDELGRARESAVLDVRRELGGEGLGPQDAIDQIATELNARVVLLQSGTLVYRDSSEVGGDVRGDPIIALASRTDRAVSGRVERDGRSYAEVATPVPGFEGYILLLSAPLDDALAGVRLIGRSLLVAGLVALIASAVAAYWAAYGLTRRLRRLETAASQIAAGDFSRPIEAKGEDEVAELAREFETMRVRLADLDRARREFIANASHELRTPLFSLGGFLELLADEDLDEETRREFLEETRAQVSRLTRLATDLLDLSRLDAGRLHVERGAVDLAEAARTLADEFRLLAEAEERPLEVVADEPVSAVGDEERVIRIGRALLENALDHPPPGAPVKVVAGHENGHAVLAVWDGGGGIAPEDRERVFQRFYRGEGGKASGSGLGLAIAAELAARMGGRLTLESEPGETRFVLELPPAEAISRENGAGSGEGAVGPASVTTL